MKKAAIVVGIIVVIGIIASVGCGGKEDSPSTGKATEKASPAKPKTKPQERKPDVIVDAAKILADYEANEVAADNKYKGKIAEITGIVDKISKGIMGGMYVTLGTGRQFEMRKCQFFFSKGAEGQLAGLSKGVKATIRGRVDGLMMNVLVKECALVSGSGAGAAAGSVPKTKTDKSSLLKMSAAEIIRAYESNEVAADQKYKGRTVEVTGVVGDISKDFMGEPFMTLGTGKQFEIPSCQCYFVKEDHSKLGTLRKGQTVTIRGTVDGLMMNVQLKNCRLVTR